MVLPEIFEGGEESPGRFVEVLALNSGFFFPTCHILG